jgi:hypothetical protein
MARALLSEWSMEQVEASIMASAHVPRDWAATQKDVRNAVGSDGQELVRLDPEDIISIEAHARNDQDKTYVYQAQVIENGVQVVPIVWGFGTATLLAALLEYGHDQPVVIDSTFGTNKYMVQCWQL